jgi:hypothetical protein
MKNPDGPAPEPESYEDAMKLALDYAVGRRTNWNQISSVTYPDDPVATIVGVVGSTLADTATAQMWAAIAQAMTSEKITNPIDQIVSLPPNKIDLEQLTQTMAHHRDAAGTRKRQEIISIADSPEHRQRLANHLASSYEREDVVDFIRRVADLVDR